MRYLLAPTAGKGSALRGRTGDVHHGRRVDLG
eukprot:SAG31_NODE_948_length_10825_cov_9.412829_2_plen_32_part_00